MSPEELNKLLNLTAIQLSEDKKPEFLNYFNSMKNMFDEFTEFSFPESNINSEDDESIKCFTEQKNFDGLDIISTNVKQERQVNHAIEVNSAIGE